ncbi:MAG: O-antigen ligase family protein [Gaiellales bacterium]
MNATLTMPRFATGRLDVPLVVVASLLAIGASFVVANGSGIVLRSVAATIGGASIAIVFASMNRLELALYAFIPLLTAVRAEPAPVDFMTVGLLGALALRGELRTFVPPRIVLIAIGLFLLSYAASLLGAQDRDLALKYTAATLLVVGAGYVAFQLVARNVGIAERAYVVAGLILGIEVIIAIVPSPIAEPFRMDRFRIEGLFKDPNVFGPFVAPAIALLCARWPSLHWSVRTGAILLALLPVPASLARGAIVVVALTLLVLGLVALYRRWRTTAIFCFGFLGAGLAALIAFVLFSGASLARERLSTIFQGYDAVRFGGQAAGLSWFQQHPISFGLGPGNYDYVLGLPSHQTFLRMLVETGPISLIAFVLILWTSIRMIRSADPGTLAWVAGLIGFTAYSLLIDAVHWRHFWVVVAIPLAIAARDQLRGLRPGRPETSTS